MKSETTRAVLALITICLIALLIAGLFFVRIPTANKDMVNTALGFVAGLATAVISYYFGSSESSKQKTDLLNRPSSATGKPGDPVHIESEDK